MAARAIQNNRQFAIQMECDFVGAETAGKILLLADDDETPANIATVLSGELRHQVEFLELDSWKQHDLQVLAPDLLLIIACRGADTVAVEICQAYRLRGGMAPILVILDVDAHVSRVSILDAGADDYLLEPVNNKELAARVETLLRRPPIIYQRFLVAGHVSIDTVNGIVKKDDEEVHLRPMEYNLLEFLMQHPNQVFTSQFLWQRIWKSTSRSYSDTVRTHIKTLRIKLDKEGQPSIISTVRARGYRLDSPEANKWAIP